MTQLVVTYGSRPPFGARLLSRRRTTIGTPALRHLDTTTDPRTTLAHVKVLEATLEEQVHRVTELTEQLRAAQARPHEDVRRMAATVEGLRVAFGKDPVAQRLLSRIDAALDRLVAPADLVRVPLREPRAVRDIDTAPAGTASTLTATPGPSGPDERTASSSTAVTADTPEAPRVLPVPSPPEPTSEPRRRRKLRR